MNPTWTSVASAGPSAFGTAGTPAAKAGATWDSLWQGNAAGSYNTVRPRFTNASLPDQYRPSDRVLVNASIRYDNFTYILPDSPNAADVVLCRHNRKLHLRSGINEPGINRTAAPGQPPPANAQYVVGDCNTAAAVLHPNGVTDRLGTSQRHDQDGVTAPNVHRQLAELVQLELLGAALLGDVHAIAGHGVPRSRPAASPSRRSRLRCSISPPPATTARSGTTR